MPKRASLTIRVVSVDRSATTPDFAVRPLAALVGEAGECRVGIVQKIHLACEILIVERHLERMLGAEIEIQTGGGELTRLAPFVDEDKSLQVGVGKFTHCTFAGSPSNVGE
jgi:hypothetical protein